MPGIYLILRIFTNLEIEKEDLLIRKSEETTNKQQAYFQFIFKVVRLKAGSLSEKVNFILSIWLLFL